MRKNIDNFSVFSRSPSRSGSNRTKHRIFERLDDRIAMTCNGLGSIDFDDLSDGTVVTQQYQDEGVSFGYLLNPGGPKAIRETPSNMVLRPDQLSNLNNGFEMVFSAPVDYFEIMSLNQNQDLSVAAYLGSEIISDTNFSAPSFGHANQPIRIGDCQESSLRFDSVQIKVDNHPTSYSGTFDDAFYQLAEKPQLTISDVRMNEGLRGHQEFQFELTLSRAIDISFEASLRLNHVSTSRNDVFINSDFLSRTVVRFDPNQQTATFSAFVVGDQNIEADEIFELEIIDLFSRHQDIDDLVLVADSIGTGTIVNDDGGSVLGSIYRDSNLNGVRDPGENGYGNIDVYLDLNSNGAHDTDEPITKTFPETGEYSFSALAPGNYTVRAIVPENYVQTSPTSRAPNAFIYAHDTRGNFLSINPDTEDVEMIGRLQTGNLPPIVDIGPDPNGNLYAISETQIYELGLDGQLNLLGFHGVPHADAMAFGPDGNIYVLGNATLRSLNIHTAQFIDYHTGYSSGGALMHYEDSFYMISRSNELVELDILGNLVTWIGVLPERTVALTDTSDGKMLALTADQVLEINPDTGGVLRHVSRVDTHFANFESGATLTESGAFSGARNIQLVHAARNVDFGIWLNGDFDGDDRISTRDIDLLCDELKFTTGHGRYDLNHDGQNTFEDHTFFVRQIARTVYGDANLDGEFNSSDLVQVFQEGEYEDNVIRNSAWTDGDWNCDGEFTTGDLVLAFRDGGYEESALRQTADRNLPTSEISAAIADRIWNAEQD